MLEKNKKIQYFDAHFHYFDSIKKGDSLILDNFDGNWAACSSAHSKVQWEFQKENFLDRDKGRFLSYGIHPQSLILPDFKAQEELDFLEKLLRLGQVDAIGELGFDFFTKDFRASAKEQEYYFLNQLELACKFQKPIIIHCRKANEKLFYYSNILKKLSAVLFHSFMGSKIEAESLLKKGINCFFSFGKQISNNNKNAISCILSLPLENLLLETDAPYQFLKGEEKTYLQDIKKVYQGAFLLRKEKDFFDFSKQLYENSKSFFNYFY